MTKYAKPTRKRGRSPAKPRRRSPLTPAAQAVCQRIRAIWEQRKAENKQDYGFYAVTGTAEMNGGHFSEIINGKIPPGVETLDKLADALSVTMADLVAINDTPQAKLLDLARQLSAPQVSHLLKTGYALLPNPSAIPLAAERREKYGKPAK